MVNVTITESAQEYLAGLLEKQNCEGIGIRMFISDPGTPKAETCIAYSRPGEHNEEDEIVEYDQFNAYFEQRRIPFMDGAKVDFAEDKFGGQLTIRAPNSRVPNVTDDSPIEDRINYLLHSEINPGLASHGGNVSLASIDEGFAILEFGGGCQGCSSVSLTLKEGVEKTLMEKIPEFVSIPKDRLGNNFLTAISNGTSEGIKMAVNVGAMLLVFISLIALLNGVFSGIGESTGLNVWIAQHTPYTQFSIEFVLGYLFAPLMWLIGVATEDMALMGQLLGIKIVASEFVGYVQLVDLKNVSNVMHFGHQKSVVMATYMLCGFANFASIGIQIGGIGILAPNQRKNLSELGLKAMIAGSIVSLMSATIAGAIMG